FSSRRRHTRSDRDWSSDVCSSDLAKIVVRQRVLTCAQRFLEPLDRGIVISPDVSNRAKTVVAVCRVVLQSDGALEVGFRCIEPRSEERRVGKECRARWWACDVEK